MTPVIWWPAFGCSFADSDCAVCAGCRLRLRMARSGMTHRGCGRPVRTLRTFFDDRAAPMAPVLYFLCAKEMTPIMLVACFWCSFADSECAFCAGCPLRLRMLRSGMMHRGCGRGRAHVAHLFVRSGGSYGTCVVLFVCEGSDTDYYVACFWCSFADSDCAFCAAGCQLRLRMLRSGMMHRGCGRPVRARCAPFCTIGRLLAHLFCTFCVRSK